MKAIQIPSPCNEDWNKMTPTEKGAHCQVCQINVVDYSKMTLHDTKVQLLAEMSESHSCGRLSIHQINQLNEEYNYWKSGKKKQLQSHFLWALLLVFGLSLFSCNEDEANAITQLNEITLLENPSIAANGAESQTSQSLSILEGVVTEVQLVTGCEVLDGEFMLLEEIDHPSIDTIEYWGYHQRMAGAIAYHEDFDVFLEESITKDSLETTLPDPIFEDFSLFTTKVYPNPTINESTLEIEIEQSNQFEIQLFSIDGAFINTIYSGQLNEGKQRFTIDLYDQPSGMYLIVVISENQKETLKLSKTT